MNEVQPSAPLLSVPANRVVRPTGFGETVLAWQPLQLFTGIHGRIAIGGHLEVTTQSLLFLPHAVNLTTEPWQVPLSRIVDLRSHRRLAAALLTVTLDDGSEHSFVCWKRDAVAEAVARARGSR